MQSVGEKTIQGSRDCNNPGLLFTVSEICPMLCQNRTCTSLQSKKCSRPNRDNAASYVFDLLPISNLGCFSSKTYAENDRHRSDAHLSSGDLRKLRFLKSDCSCSIQFLPKTLRLPQRQKRNPGTLRRSPSRTAMDTRWAFTVAPKRHGNPL